MEKVSCDIGVRALRLIRRLRIRVRGAGNPGRISTLGCCARVRRRLLVLGTKMSLEGKKVLLLIDFSYEDMEVQYPKIRLEEEGATVVVCGAHPAKTKYTGKFGTSSSLNALKSAQQPCCHSAFLNVMSLCCCSPLL